MLLHQPKRSGRAAEAGASGGSTKQATEGNCHQPENKARSRQKSKRAHTHTHTHRSAAATVPKGDDDRDAIGQEMQYNDNNKHISYFEIMPWCCRRRSQSLHFSVATYRTHTHTPTKWVRVGVGCCGQDGSFAREIVRSNREKRYRKKTPTTKGSFRVFESRRVSAFRSVSARTHYAHLRGELGRQRGDRQRSLNWLLAAKRSEPSRSR